MILDTKLHGITSLAFNSRIRWIYGHIDKIVSLANHRPDMGVMTTGSAHDAIRHLHFTLITALANNPLSAVLSDM